MSAFHPNRSLTSPSHLAAFNCLEGAVPFTDEEFRRWHEEKQKREHRAPVEFLDPPIAVCVHCDQPFGITQGVVTDQVGICDVCNGD
jgi:hypothetical protein